MVKNGEVVEVASGQDLASKTEATITALIALLQSKPAAEELASTWTRAKGETLRKDGPRLEDLRKALDSGKAIRRTTATGSAGIPMWIVVRMCKATWHQDGSWPLLGADEESLAESAANTIIRSAHASSLLLRPPATKYFQIPEEEECKVRAAKPEPTADEIAASYRRRGFVVAEAEPVIDDW